MPMSSELRTFETVHFVPDESERVLKYVAPETFEVDGIVYKRPMWYSGGMLKLYNDDENDTEEYYRREIYNGEMLPEELIVIEPGDEFDPSNKPNSD